MIRSLQKADINRVADIWLDTNLKAHSFISAQYWESNYELVKEMLSQAEVYVYEDGQKIQGFIGLSDKYIEGILRKDMATKIRNEVRGLYEHFTGTNYKKGCKSLYTWW